MTDAVMSAAQTEMPAEEAERKPVPPPEPSEAAKAGPEHPQPALMPEAIFAPETQGNIIVLEQVREQAELNLTHYLAPKLIEALKARGQSDGMILKLFEQAHISLFGELGQNGKTDVKITVAGPNIGANEALVGELLMHALQEHPLYGGILTSSNAPHAQKVPGSEHALIQIHIPGMETAQYAQFMQALAALGKPTMQTGEQSHPAKKDTPEAQPQAHAEGCACEHCHAAAPAANDNEVTTEAAPAPETVLTEVANHEPPTKAKALG